MAMMHSSTFEHQPPLGVGKRLLESMPHMISSSRATIGIFPKVQVTQIKQGCGFTSTNTYDENIRLKKRVKELEAQVDALKKALFNSGVLGKESAHHGALDGLVKRRGAPITNPKKRRDDRMKAAEAVVELSTLIQGPDRVGNAVDFLQAAASQEPTILNRLALEGLLAERLEEVVDKRYTAHGCKRTRVAPVVSINNAFLWQAGSRATNETLHELRRLGGKALVKTPEELQMWAAGHPDLPELRFVLPGTSAVWAPPVDLLKKLMSNTAFRESLRTTAPYTRLHFCQKTFVWYLVSILASFIVLASVILSSSIPIENQLCSYT